MAVRHGSAETNMGPICASHRFDNFEFRAVDLVRTRPMDRLDASC